MLSSTVTFLISLISEKLNNSGLTPRDFIKAFLAFSSSSEKRGEQLIVKTERVSRRMLRIKIRFIIISISSKITKYTI